MVHAAAISCTSVP